MYYEVYVDVLFVKNLWMNAVLLTMMVWADQKKIRPLRIVTAAAAGSLGACVLYIVSARLARIHYILGSVVLAAGMTGIACPGRKHFAGRMLCLYMEGFLFNGILRYLEQFHRLSGLWFAVFGSISAVFLMTAEYIGRNRRRAEERSFSVILHHGACAVPVGALYDTGNSLYDPISQKAVSILDGDILDTLLERSGKEKLPRYIPYHTISEQGVLESYILDGMELETGDGNRWIGHPVIARMPGKSGQYQLILHRDLLSS